MAATQKQTNKDYTFSLSWYQSCSLHVTTRVSPRKWFVSRLCGPNSLVSAYQLKVVGKASAAPAAKLCTAD